MSFRLACFSTQWLVIGGGLRVDVQAIHENVRHEKRDAGQVQTSFFMPLGFRGEDICRREIFALKPFAVTVK